MRTRCGRPGCGFSAVGAVVLDRLSCTVYVHDTDLAPHGAILLCTAHLARVAMGDGWTVEDQREAVSAAFSRARPSTRDVAPTRSFGPMPEPTTLSVDAHTQPLLSRAFRNTSGRVVETRLMFGPTLKFVAAYRFPGVIA